MVERRGSGDREGRLVRGGGEKVMHVCLKQKGAEVSDVRGAKYILASKQGGVSEME